jgi:hypothetical protein
MGWLIFEDSILRISAGRPINSACPDQARHCEVYMIRGLPIWPRINLSIVIGRPGIIRNVAGRPRADQP